ncbi:MAG TPA: hydrolase, partial [Planctomycetota bacterium]|nr:hydrolase [Planctomycetota bacterium]
MRAVRLVETPVLDGDVLGDPAWAAAAPVSEFWQTRPFAGEPASERTEVRVGFTDSVLYIGVVCFDREPDKIIVSDARRDASLDDTDSFRLIVDAFRDQQNGFVFGTN